MTPRDAARRGDALSWRAQYDDVLSPFIAYADDYECYPDRHGEIDADVVEYAKELLAGETGGAA